MALVSVISINEVHALGLEDCTDNQVWQNNECTDVTKPPKIIPESMSSPQLEEYSGSHFVSAKKLGKLNLIDLKINEEKDQLVSIQMVDPFPGYGEGKIALELISADIKNHTYSNFKSLGFENLIDYTLNSKTGKIYLYEFERQDILIIDSSSLEIIDTIEVHFETNNYRQRDIAVDENSNKIYLLLEDMGWERNVSVHALKYKIQVFDGNVKKMIKEIELNEPVDRLLIDQTNNFVYADNWVEQKYFIIDNNEELNSISIPATANQYISSFLINEKNNQMFIVLSDERGYSQQMLVLDVSSGKEIERIDKPNVPNSAPIISTKNDVLIFTVGGYNQYERQDQQSLVIMNLHDGENKIVKEIPLPDMDVGSLLTIDEKNGKLYSKITDQNIAIYDLYDLLTTSTQGNPEIESEISEEYKSCWDNIRKIDNERARESYFSSDGISSYWIESETMFNEMIYKCEKIKIDALEEAKIQEAILKEQRLSFPKTVDSRCDLVYLLNRITEERDGFTLFSADEIYGELGALQSKYQQKISDEPWNAEELTQEMRDILHESMTDLFMKKYSISPNLREVVSKMIVGGTYDVDVLRSIMLLEPKHYAEDIECGKMLKTHYYDEMYQLNESVYGQSSAEKMDVAIDEAIREAEGNTNSIDSTLSKKQSISEIKCGIGTMEKNGQCVRDSNYKSAKPSLGGGCLIATATYGSELAPQVQQLRELRDNSLLQTASGTSFMSGFNDFYYSFSPTIADWERESPAFKEMVKIVITPMISSLSNRFSASTRCDSIFSLSLMRCLIELFSISSSMPFQYSTCDY